MKKVAIPASAAMAMRHLLTTVSRPVSFGGTVVVVEGDLLVISGNLLGILWITTPPDEVLEGAVVETFSEMFEMVVW